jgi:glycosyltransferase involved in cell wall biosynthesis
MVTVTGLERMTFEVLRVLREQGAPVHCIVNDWESHRIVAMAERIGASWSESTYRVRLDRHTRNPLRLARMLWDIVKISAGLLRESWRFRPTHILMPEFMAVLRNAPALVLLRMVGVKVVLRLGNAPEAGSFYRRVWRWVVDPLVDQFVCNSRFTEEQLLAHGIRKSKSVYIYNTAPSRGSGGQDRTIVRDPKKIIFVGQIIPEKGVSILLEAVGLLVNKGLDVHLDIVGQVDGWVALEYSGYKNLLFDRIRQPDLDGRVTFLGYREDVPDLLAGAAIHCCPSLPEQREAFGVVNIEAKVAGVPSVVFPSGALSELIAHGDDGWICSEISAESLAEGIEYFLRSPEKLEHAGYAARMSAENFNHHLFANKWLKVFMLHIDENVVAV